jgi:hypothetical protein
MSLAYVHNDDDFIPVVRSRTVPVAILDDGQPVAFRPVPSPALALQQQLAVRLDGIGGALPTVSRLPDLTIIVGGSALLWTVIIAGIAFIAR